MVDVENGEIIVLKCFVCNRDLQQGDLAYCLFSSRQFHGGSNDVPISEVLSSILAIEISEESVHSKIVCNDCNDRVSKYEELEQQMLELKYKILEDFNITTRLNDGVIQFEIEETFDIAMEEQLEEEANNTESVLDGKQPLIKTEPSKNAEVLSLLSETKTEPENIMDNPHIDHAPTIKKETITSDLDEADEFFDQNPGNMVEVISEADDYGMIMPRDDSFGETADENVKEKVEKNSSDDDTVDAQSLILFDGIKYGCMICPSDSSNIDQNIRFESINSLYAHFQTDHEIEVHVCKECDEHFLERENLTQHMFEKHGIEEKPLVRPFYSFNGESFSCLLCPEDSDAAKAKSTARAMSTHFKSTHNMRLYICDICGIDFKKRMELTSHVDEAHGGTEDGEFECEHCRRVFTNLRQFRIHKRLHYTTPKAYQCDQCNKKYSSKNLLDEHMNMHTGLRPYKCANCPKDFASKYTLTAHMKIHSDRPRPFSCKQCGKAFFSAQNLLQHEKIHTGLKEYICVVCSKAFATQHNLEVHKVVHTGYKPFICRTCGKAFARRAEIKDHERTHTGERPFVCDICNMSFAQRSNLTTHKRATHLNDKRYKCEQCDRSFKRRRLLDYHIRSSHTGERPYVCMLCNATFVYPEHYKKHLRIHSGVKPYSCEVCGKSFNSRDNRNAHRFIHSDKKPYECLVCGQGFMRKPLLYTHMQQSGHVNDTIIINQPRIMTEPENTRSDGENVLIEMVDEDDLVEEQLIDGQRQYDSLIDDLIEEDDENSVDDDLAETITSDQFDDSNSMQLVQIRTKDETGKEAFTWVNLVSEKNS